jgi:hypothetical protein
MRCAPLVGRLVGLLVGTFASATVARAQAADSLPFGSGERLTFAVRASRFGTVGHAVMAVTGPVEVRGVETLLVSLDAHLGLFFMKSTDVNRSWIDPRRMASLRFEKHNRRPFSSFDDSVEIYPDRHYWSGEHGDSGVTTGAAPLDELSFIYYLRTVTLAPDSTYAFDRHYDRRRIPSTVRLVKRELLRTPAGEFNTDELEVRVKDGTNWKDEWVVRLWISDDPCRLPVRMESSMPILGTGDMTLESAVTPTCMAGESAAHQAAGGALPDTTPGRP